MKRRLKKEEHSLRVRIRNQLLAQYFPEIDRHFGSAISLAVVGRFLDPSAIAGMEFDDFRLSVFPGRISLAQQKLLKTIWKIAPESMGCHVGDATPFEAKVMVSKLHQVRETIKAVDDEIEGLCNQFEEYPYLMSIPGFGPRCLLKGFGCTRVSLSLYRLQAGPEDGGVRSLCGTQRQDISERNTCYLQARAG